MNKEWVITQEAFDRLLAWLHADREQAAARYESIRRRLVEIFNARRCEDAEALADETINRVTLKTLSLGEGYTGDPALYFYAVAKKVHLEYLRRRPASATLEGRPLASAPPAEPEADEEERAYECLERCLERLPARSRELVLRYHQEEGGGRKIESRKELAGQMGLALNALRIRAFRIRAALRQCVLLCLEQDAPQ